MTSSMTPSRLVSESGGMLARNPPQGPALDLAHQNPWGVVPGNLGVYQASQGILNTLACFSNLSDIRIRISGGCGPGVGTYGRSLRAAKVETRHLRGCGLRLCISAGRPVPTRPTGTGVCVCTCAYMCACL